MSVAELPTADEQPGIPFLVAGVGASAGGLEAYTELLEALPASPNFALLLVSHLDPGQKSHLVEILSRVCKMPVQEAAEGMKVKVNSVYVIPPGTTMTLVDGHLMLTARPPRNVQHMPIDHLFRSLASIQKSRSAAIVLSGNGSDGVIALQAIKAAGGVTFAQEEQSAKHPSMPRAAALDGNVDHILRPRDIARELERIARHPYAQTDEAPPDAPAVPTRDPVADIIDLLRNRTGVDFTHYKQTTIRRRIMRRMALRNFQSPTEYLALLRTDATEVQNLYQDFLIRVTQFFRDPEAFEAIKEKVFPALLKNRPAGSPVRIWVAGCATGEEAYSLAMCLLEFLDGRAEVASAKILATDLNEVALEKARAGLYLDNIEIDVSPERLRRFFVRTEGHYQISKAVRELCVFSRHNMATDPPFSRIDLVSCRNVLIYMDAALQKRVMPLLHYALNPYGILFLGSSENVGGAADLFEVVDAKHRLFARSSAASMPLDFNASVSAEGRPRPVGREEGQPLWTALDVQKEADRVLLARYAPVGVVVDETMTVLQFRGRTASYLEPAPGMATLDLFRMLREGLLAEVRAATNQAKAENSVITRDGIQLTEGTTARTVRVEVVPFKVPPSGVRFFLILFQDAPQADRVPAPPAEAQPTPNDLKVAQLQQEIGALREYLQSVIEEQESTNEELKSANEEILSANEELQSTNEELQTAKEEAQSANEELSTVNEELRHRNSELARVNNDLVNLLSGVGLPIVMVGRDLRIRRFTPLAEKAFNLIATDVGRPISDMKPNLRLDDFPGMIARVIDSLTPFEGEVQDGSGHWFSLRIRPYVTLDSKIDGASIVLVDVDAIRRQIAPKEVSGS
ncbi:signal transduction histidine kinase with and activity : Protein-glutamate methylesterase OS=Anabaena variabilis (strain ATCC 29413 / PCC 7937) GN=Ava_0314 PE=4 SV=1: CheB_methylest: CheR_N: CheR: PAS_10 [Gemmata massiliana]|uniref:protein-glutamate O-methyltransferase n=1 Tax=Gemmata massiliana TaxID=1210884 RepID=A0A6P2CWU2_9BACT|nr:CheR family methyltransferase [Gemmata massiliana]VTR92856.1 signal transduction histidine kinase with and activity : Protein-glutamate methylesterase OS=Anabaena variabilis (strain ATCC 29413 / PCC 7937) GN=Ava_0314 PE=4 SV=1: CheB_methylest: CheR_N: CheR: PAS_10 [Gemmata massiliana]